MNPSEGTGNTCSNSHLHPPLVHAVSALQTTGRLGLRVVESSLSLVKQALIHPFQSVVALLSLYPFNNVNGAMLTDRTIAKQECKPCNIEQLEDLLGPHRGYIVEPHGSKKSARHRNMLGAPMLSKDYLALEAFLDLTCCDTINMVKKVAHSEQYTIECKVVLLNSLRRRVAELNCHSVTHPWHHQAIDILEPVIEEEIGRTVVVEPAYKYSAHERVYYKTKV